jgi:hypothetical protein
MKSMKYFQKNRIKENNNVLLPSDDVHIPSDVMVNGGKVLAICTDLIFPFSSKCT